MATAPRGRGRPSRLSREQIIAAAFDLIEQDPKTPLTVKRVADAVAAAPMALYRYFPDRDDLLQAVAEHVLASTQPRSPTGDTWQEQVRSWMSSSQERLRRYAQLLPFMISTRQPVGLRAVTTLADILRPLDLSDADRALAVALIGSTNFGYAVYDTNRAPVEQTAAAMREAVAERPAEEREVVEPLLPWLPDADARLYGVVLDQVIATIEGLAASRAPR